VEASIPGFVAVSGASWNVEVVPSSITMVGLPALVGAGLRRGDGYQYAYLDGPNHGGVTLHIESSDPSVALVAHDPATPGAAAVDIFLPDGVAYASYSIDGVNQGTATITATASGFVAKTGKVLVVPSAVHLVGLPMDVTTQVSDIPLQVYVGVPDPTNSYLSEWQAVPPGPGIVATVTNSDPSVAQLTVGGLSGQSVMMPDSSAPRGPPST
jgi:hypothetical protein